MVDAGENPGRSPSRDGPAIAGSSPAPPFHVEGLVVDNFAGGGGASLGIERALGRLDIAINHDAEAIAMHRANHPATHHVERNIWQVDPLEATGGRRVALAWFSPDCFPAGTLVLTKEGYRPIEDIRVGDEVLSHTLSWRRVTETHRTRKPVMEVKGHGHPGLCVTPEHPFWARRRRTFWNNDIRRYDHELENVDWVSASMLDRGWYWATPRRFPKAEPPPVGGRGFAVDGHLMWLAGRYLADGWTRLNDTHAELVITCGQHEAEGLRSELDRWRPAGARAGFNELSWQERETGTAYQFATSHRGLVTWLRAHFGHRAEAKRIPAWALGMPSALRSSLVRGYVSGDGWTNAVWVECNTVSKALAFGLKGLLNSIGKTVTIYHRLPNSSIIEGRSVNSRPIYMLRYRHEVDFAHQQTEVTRGGPRQEWEWCPIRSATEPGDIEDVFNIGVETDESYVVEGIIVHNCKHFSKAKGKRPLQRNIRDLAWVVVLWARRARPAVICLENVEEFRSWGPLDLDDQPIKERSGETFKRWVADLRKLGYRVEWRELRACDYGSPTVRKRLFVVARCDGLPIVWPEPTHGEGLLPYRTAAECIDWSIPCPSIFLSAEEGRALGVKRPLADATMRRIARGTVRYVLEAADPFIVPANDDIAAPYLVPRYGERPGQMPRCGAIDEPAPTIVPTANGANLVAAFLAQHNTGLVGHDARRPMSTMVQKGCTQGVVAAFLSRQFGGSTGQGAAAPAPTTTAGGGGKTAIVAAALSHQYSSNTNGGDGRLRQPHRTVTAGGRHQGLIAAFLTKYYGEGGQWAAAGDPMHTMTAKARMGLVTVSIDGTTYVLDDIGMRMLTPRELFRAQGFPDSYRIDPAFNGKPLTKTAQIRMCGNSVCPQVAEAIVRANVGVDQAARAA